MKQLAAFPVLILLLTGAAPARAETSPVEAGSDAGFDVVIDTSIVDVSSDAGAAEAIAEDTIATDTEGTDTLSTDSIAADSIAADDADSIAADGADSGRPGPGTVVENPDDVFRRDRDPDACTCTAPRRTDDTAAFAALIGLAAVVLRRKRR